MWPPIVISAESCDKVPRDSSVGVVAKPRGGLPRNRGSIPRRIKRFSSTRNRPDLVE